MHERTSGKPEWHKEYLNDGSSIEVGVIDPEIQAQMPLEGRRNSIGLWYETLLCRLMDLGDSLIDRLGPSKKPQ